MTLRASELEDVAREVGRALDGRAVQKIVQPDDVTVLMGLRGGWLLLSADARAGRMALVDKPAGTGEQAPAFCMLLRKELMGLPLRSVAAVAGERAVELTFAFAERVRRLRLFLYGAGAQLQLVGDDDRIVGHIGPAKKIIAELPPPKPGQGAARSAIAAGETEGAAAASRGDREGAAATGRVDREGAAAGHVDGEGAATGRVGREGAATGHVGREGAATESRVDREGATPTSRVDREGAATASRFDREAPSAAIVAHYAVARADRDAAQADAQRRAALKKQERLVAALREDLARADAAADRKKWGDLLFAHLHEVPRGAANVTLPDDFGDGAPLEIALDPARSARDNATRFYKEHKRLSRARANIEARLATAEALRDKLERGDFVPPQAKQAKQTAGTAKGKRAGKAERPPPYREFRSASGAAILVGRGADRNDELTFKVARGNDLWLHARDHHGAHVVVPTGGRPVDQETLVDAATLAAYHSQARGEAQVDIVYVPRKHVRKPPKSAPGSVTHAGGKTLRVRVEAKRIERLLAARVE